MEDIVEMYVVIGDIEISIFVFWCFELSVFEEFWFDVLFLEVFIKVGVECIEYSIVGYVGVNYVEYNMFVSGGYCYELNEVFFLCGLLFWREWRMMNYMYMEEGSVGCMCWGLSL